MGSVNGFEDSGSQVAVALESAMTPLANVIIASAAARRNVGGQSGSAGSGQSEAQITARHAASGRRAHQICNVEICPWRIDFSRRAYAEIRLMGKSTSKRRWG